MSTFAKASFNAASYSAARPTYPPKLFEYIFRYYKNQPEHCTAQWDRAADIGCGTGQATSNLRDVFKEVVCIDPSAGMLRKARDFLSSHRSSPSASLLAAHAEGIASQFTFMQGSAEDLQSAIPSPHQDGSIDLVIAAQACHWFDWSKVWPETRRVLRPKGGVAAFWIYGELGLTAFPTTKPLITDFWQGTDRDSTTSVGAYFQRPGRTILERLLVDVPSPAAVLGDQTDLKDFQRLYFTDDPSTIPSLDLTDAPQIVHPTLMRKQWRWIDILAYMRTASALHSYHERFPEDLSKPDDSRFLEQDLADVSNARDAKVDLASVKGGDIAIRFWKNLRQNVQKEIGEAKDGEVDSGVGVFDKVTVEWPVAMLLVRRV